MLISFVLVSLVQPIRTPAAPRVEAERETG
jgi:hypothetical protein